MPSFDVNQLKRQASKAFAGFTSGQRAMLGIAGLATIVGAYLFLSMSSTASYAPLYSNLAASDASSVTQQLTAAGVPYKLSGGGSTVLVPQDRVYQLRLDMSAKGLPQDGAAGYSLLDNTGITTSEFQQRVDYQRAMEGELAKTINAIDGVQGSTVHLVIPQQDLFTNDSQHPSASVLVKTTKALGSGTVQSIVHLVSSAVEGLTPEQVTVADDKGRMLAAPGVDGTATAAGDARTEQTTAFQDSVARQVEDMLSRVTGPGKAKVQVSAALDFDTTKTTTESFAQPNGPLSATSSTQSEQFSGSGTPVGGALGTDPAANPLGATSTGGNSTYTKSDTQTQNAIDKTTKTVQNAPGKVQKLSVAVLVDASANVGAQEVQDLVTAAVGLDTTRGDSIQVKKLVFDTSVAADAKAQLDAASKGSSDSLTNLLRTVAAVLIVLVVLFLAWRSSKKAAVARYPMAIPIDPMALEAPARSLGAGRSAAPSGDKALLEHPDALPSPADVVRDQTQGQIVDLIDRQPDDVAQVLRGWLSEKR